MTDEINLEKVVLYHGSLAELNSHDPNKQYKFADSISYVSKVYARDSSNEVRNELQKKGFDGLVNRRTFAIVKDDAFEGGAIVCTHSLVGIEGTPIIRVSEK